ncbi:MAG: colicin uptake protein TolR [Arsenophonus endosymbiont of Ceratovacuna japonica]
MVYKNKNKRKLRCEINIVPLLDVLLVLLLIFISTSPIIFQSIKVELPNTIKSQNISFNDNSFIIIEIFGIGKYNIIVNGHRKELLLPRQIEIFAKDIYIKKPNTIFFIGGSKNIPYEEIIKILNILHKVGIKSVGFMTKAI